MAIRISFAIGLTAILTMGFAAVSAAPPGPGAAVHSVFIDFERSAGVWSSDSIFASDSLGIAVVRPDRCNASARALHCFTLPGNAAGAVTFDFARNGLDPIPISPATTVAWSWRVSRKDSTNGLWIVLCARDLRTGRMLDIRAAHRLQKENDVFRNCYDPALTWMYHEETIWEYVILRWGDLAPGDMRIESVTLAMSESPRMEALVDNIWIGNGPAPKDVDIVACERGGSSSESKPTGFSAGIFGLDPVPELVVMHHERIDLVDNRYEKSSDGEYRKVRILDEIPLRPFRGNGAASVLDVDNDGRADVIAHFRDSRGNMAFSGKRTGRLVRVEADSALAQREQPMRGSAAADIDRDGLLDLVLLHPYARLERFGGLRVARNAGGWRFEDVTRASGVPAEWAFGAAFGDVDGDKDADLFVGYRPFYEPDTFAGIERLYLNDGVGRFEVSSGALPIPQDIFIEGGVFADFDGDADLDLYVAVSETYGDRGLPRNLLLLNDGTGRFEDASEASGADCPLPSLAAAAEDFDLDSDVDIFLANGREPCILYWNDGTAHFEADTLRGIAEHGEVKRGVAADVDADGDPDMLLLIDEAKEIYLWENPTRGRGVSVSLWCTENNRFGVGSKIYVYEAGHLDDPAHRIGYREMSIASGFGTYRPPVCQIGLGGRASADVRVVFPPVEDHEPLTATKLGVPAGSAVTLCEYGGLASRVFENRRLYAARWRIERGIFLVPSWAFGLIALALAGTLGFIARTSVAAGRIHWPRVLLFAAATVATTLAFDRGAAWGASFALAFAGVYAFAPAIEARWRRTFDSAGRNELAGHILESVFKMRHCRAEYEILETLYNGDRHGGAPDFREARAAVARLLALTSSMRRYAPDDGNWRIARREALRMKGALRRLERSDDASAQAKETLHGAIAAASKALGDFREEMRRAISVPFMERWRLLERGKTPELEAAGVFVETSFAPGVEAVSVHLADNELRFIFDNLFVNSIHALSGAADKRIRVEGAVADSSVVIEWLDSGPGIPPELEGRLFNRLVSSGRPGGSGRGLYETARMLEYKDGGIRLAAPPRPGWGAHFVVRLLVTKG